MRAVIGHNINMFSIVDWLCFLTDRQRIRNQYMIGASYHRRMKQGHPFFLRAYAVSETRNKLKFTTLTDLIICTNGIPYFLQNTKVKRINIYI